MNRRPVSWTLKTFLVCLAIVGCAQEDASETVEPTYTPELKSRTLEQRLGTVYTPSTDTMKLTSSELDLPAIEHAESIWGALGRDDRGHIWFGLSANFRGDAHLLEFDPTTERFHDHGSPTEHLPESGEVRALEQQAKIHTRIQQADDGWLYFASMDETNENWRDNRLPEWGGNIWRIHPESGTWSHVARTQHPLIALHTAGAYVYALGYWGHMLYQYDWRRERLRSVAVGSPCGHVSRNFIVDFRGHAYVPRLDRAAGQDESCADDQFAAVLVEIDADLNVVAEHPMRQYLGRRKPSAHHGITAYAYRADESILFLTHSGQLYHLIVAPDDTVMLMSHGEHLTKNSPPVASLFSIDGKSKIGAVAMSKDAPTWLTYTMDDGMVERTTLQLQPYRAALIYGSMIRDDAGNFYVAGRLQTPEGLLRPLAMKIRR